MSVDPGKFEERPWRKPVRYFKEGLLVSFGRSLRTIGLLRNYPKRPVFIVGCPRSGTSIFNEMVSECKDVADLSEALFIWSPNDRDDNCDHMKGAADVSVADESRIKGAFGFYQFIRRKEIFVNKCPRNSVRIPYLDALFPDARYIHVYRDGRAIVNSIIDITRREVHRQSKPLGGFCKPHNWRELMAMDDISMHSHQWAEIMKALQDSKEIIEESRWLDVRYEDFCNDPGKTLNEVFRFISVKPSQQLLQKIERMPKKNDQKWKRAFSEQQIITMNTIMQSQLEAYHYEI